MCVYVFVCLFVCVWKLHLTDTFSYFQQRYTNFPRTYEPPQKLYTPEGWHTASALLRTSKYWMSRKKIWSPGRIGARDLCSVLIWCWVRKGYTICMYTGCNRRNVRDFGRVFLRSNYTDITQNTYIQSWTVTEIMAIEICGLLGCRRTVRRPWCHTCPMRLPGNETW